MSDSFKVLVTWLKFCYDQTVRGRIDFSDPRTFEPQSSVFLCIFILIVYIVSLFMKKKIAWLLLVCYLIPLIWMNTELPVPVYSKSVVFGFNSMKMLHCISNHVWSIQTFLPCKIYLCTFVDVSCWSSTSCTEGKPNLMGKLLARSWTRLLA